MGTSTPKTHTPPSTPSSGDPRYAYVSWCSVKNLVSGSWEGNPFLPPLSRYTLAQRFWNKVIYGETEHDCWGWLGATNKGGYAQLANTLAHRVSWILNYGPIPKGMWVLHYCDNPPCTNPEHLWLGTREDNMEDMWAKGRHLH